VGLGYDPRVTMTHDAEVAKPGRRGLISSLSFAVATGLGSGYSPVVPGTAGSLVGLILFLPVHALPPAAMLGALEVAGMWISLLFLPFTPFTAAAAFVIFRVLDVVKPFPARRLEDLPGGYGIMCDDLMAGAYANLLVRGLLFVWPAV
jgi:phosphatidylglycerophosphatase A